MDRSAAFETALRAALGMCCTLIFHFSQIIHHPNFPFVFLFIFRYLRLIVHLFSFWVLYKPAPVPANPTITPENDCTVIIPTVEPENRDFRECLTSVIANRPAAILIVTVGKANLRLTRTIISPFATANPHINFQVTATNQANKRRQVCHAIPSVCTSITILVDDHVFWPSTNFLRTMIAPFEDPQVGCVGTNKRVRRFHEHGFGILSFWNMIGALYLERHNFEIRATNAMDGGVFVISGRTSAHRTCILQDPDFISGFTNEMFFFGKFGPLNADDDNFITRWEVRHGWKIKVQYCPDALIETTLGTYPRFLSQCLRWVRTTWRSNSASLFTDRTVWRAQPWCVYAVYITSFFNFALFTDAGLFYTLSQTTFVSPMAYKAMAAWIFARYFIFAYYHSLIKLYAGLTFWVTAWGGRELSAVGGDDDVDNDDDNDDDDGSDTDYNGLDPDAAHGADADTTFLNDDGHDFPSPSKPSPPALPTSTLCHRRPYPYGKSSAMKPAITTPWGRATGINPHVRPTNVLEPTNPTVSTARRDKSVSTPCDAVVDVVPASRSKTSTAASNTERIRHAKCGRLHARDFASCGCWVPW